MTMDELHQWHGYSSTDSLLPLCRCCNPRGEDKDEIALDPEFDINPPVDHATAVKYELAGRDDANHSFKDFRSPAKARRRHRKRLETYYSWRGVKPGQLGKEHYILDTVNEPWSTTLLSETPKCTLTKAQLYFEAQSYPRPPKLHRSRPWERRQNWGTSDRYNGRKHARQRFKVDVDEACDFASWRFSRRRSDFSSQHLGYDWTPPTFGDEATYAVHCTDEIFEIEAMKEVDCGCACNLCHRECHEQTRREDEAELQEYTLESALHDLDAESDDEGWDMISLPSSASPISEDSWDLVGDAAGQDDHSISTAHDRRRPDLFLHFEPSDNAFNSGEYDYFNSEGYLPYTYDHFVSDLATARCRACIARYIFHSRLRYYADARVSDMAFLRGMPTKFTIWTSRAGVPFCRLLPLLVEIRDEEPPITRTEGRKIIEEAKGSPTLECYETIGLEVSEDDVMWMTRVGCE